MRNAFVDSLINQAAVNDKIILMVGDIGFNVFEEFAYKYPKQYFNVGIAEQNMIGVATGLASEGFLPVVYTIIPFLTMRPYEQIRLGVGINAQKIIMVGVGAGFSYDVLGPTHHALEDIALMRTIPDLLIHTPHDPLSVQTAFSNAVGAKYASYIRLGKNGEPKISTNTNVINRHYLSWTDPKSKICIITHGPVLNEVLKAKFDLEAKGVVCDVFSIVTWEESFSKKILNAIKKYSRVIIVEENYRIGGLADFLELNHVGNFDWLGPKHRIFSEVLARHEFLQLNKIDAESVRNHIDELGIKNE